MVAVRGCHTAADSHAWDGVGAFWSLQAMARCAGGLGKYLCLACQSGWAPAEKVLPRMHLPGADCLKHAFLWSTGVCCIVTSQRGAMPAQGAPVNLQ